jgi:hypothetical protein
LPVYDDIRVLHEFYSTVADITSLKQAEEAQKERADEALERAKQQARFIGKRYSLLELESLHERS